MAGLAGGTDVVNILPAAAARGNLGKVVCKDPDFTVASASLGKVYLPASGDRPR